MTMINQELLTKCTPQGVTYCQSAEVIKKFMAEIGMEDFLEQQAASYKQLKDGGDNSLLFSYSAGLAYGWADRIIKLLKNN